MTDAASLDPSKVNWTAVAAGTINGGAIANRTLPAGKLVLDSITAQEIAPNAIGASELADGAVDTAALQPKAVTAAQIADDTITALQIAPAAVGTSELLDLGVTTGKLADKGVTTGKIADLAVTAAQIAPNAIGSSELADGAVDTAAVQDLAITNAKLAAGITSDKITSLDGAKIQANTLTAAQIAPHAIGASELADGSVDTVAVQDLAITNAKLAAGIDGAKLIDASITNAKLAAGIDGVKLIDASITSAKLAAGIDGDKLTNDTVTAAKISASSLNRGLDKTGGAIGHTNAVAASVRSGISYDAQGHITAAVALVASDLPVATAAAVGGVSVPATSGLTVSGVGALSHANSVAAGTRNGISYDAQGHVTGSAPLVPSDLPLATDTIVGGVRIQGPALAVDATGAVSHVSSGIAAGTYPKVTVDARGHVTAGTLLAATDIPSLDASKITSGTLAAAQFKDRSITQEKLADYSISFIQEVAPSGGNLSHKGMLWFQESTGQLRMWNGNSWFAVGFGRLSAENLRYCGTFNAATGQIAGVTQFGTVEGVKIGDPLPTATDPHSGIYFVCATPGNGTLATPGVTYDSGDWVLCNGATAGWVRIDTLSGGGGSGGAAHLNDLLDVTLAAPVAGDQLVLDAGGQWMNKTPAVSSLTAAGRIQLASQAEVDAGTDALKAITPKTLQNCTLMGGTY